jgi:hypothetical protein
LPIELLIKIEALVREHPHVMQSAAYEETDALSCALSFLVQDVAVSTGIATGEDEKFDAAAREHFLFQKHTLLAAKLRRTE